MTSCSAGPLIPCCCTVSVTCAVPERESLRQTETDRDVPLAESSQLEFLANHGLSKVASAQRSQAPTRSPEIGFHVRFWRGMTPDSYSRKFWYYVRVGGWKGGRQRGAFGTHNTNLSLDVGPPGRSPSIDSRNCCLLPRDSPLPSH